jgi:hypothetical protein
MAERIDDPTLRENEQRAAEVRKQWSPEEEQRRRVQQVSPITFVPISPDVLDLGPEWEHAI